MTDARPSLRPNKAEDRTNQDASCLPEMLPGEPPSAAARPEIVGPAKLPDYKIRIGNRASLVRAIGSASYGVLLDLPEEDASALYSRPEVDGYQPESVEVHLLSDESRQRALCYLLPQDKLGADMNTEYVVKLAALVRELGLPLEYAHEIEHYGGAT